jgi:LysR family transcriptional activator of nhaA
VTQLNYHHLRYFWSVAKEGNLTRAARQLHVSQSALSAQIKQLEADLGQQLFHRTGRTLTLREAGRVALAYADGIGAVATASRNFQENFIRPVLDRDDVELALVSGSLPELLARLRLHSIDLVLCNQRVHASASDHWRCRRIARQPVSLVGRPDTAPFHFPDDLARVPLLLPGRDNEMRTTFDARCEQLGIRYRLRAEVDDMALLRLLARDSASAALMPTVVAQDELASGRLIELAVVPDLYENFYGVTIQRRYSPPLIAQLLARTDADVLAAPRP